MTTSAPLAALVDRLAAWAAPLLPESGSLPPGVAAACHLQRLAARVGELIDGTPSPLTRLHGIDVAFARLAEALPAIAPNPDLAEILDDAARCLLATDRDSRPVALRAEPPGDTAKLARRLAAYFTAASSMLSGGDASTAISCAAGEVRASARERAEELNPLLAIMHDLSEHLGVNRKKRARR